MNTNPGKLILKIKILFCGLSTFYLFGITPAMAQKMIVENMDGPVTANEINAFKAHIKTAPAPSGGLSLIV